MSAMQASKRAVIYLRVSTEQQTKRAGTDEGYSIEYQRDVCTRKAESLGAVVVDEFVDAQTAKNADRPALQALLERVEQGHDIDYIIVHKLDRLARNRLDDALLSVRFEAAKVRLVSVVEHIDETPSGTLMHALLAAFNEYQIRNHATEVMKGSVKKAEGGGTPFMAPIGYLNKRDLSDGKDARWIETDPERAPLVGWAFEMYATGDYSLARLLTELTAKGLTNRPTAKRPARPLKLSKLAEILRNPYYIGKVVYRGVEYQGKHEPIVERATFNRVQEVFQLHDLSGERLRTHRHYLKGSVFCARCEERMGFCYFKSRSGVLYPYFFCYGRMRGKGCDLPYLLADDVEDHVVEHYGIIQLEPQVVGITKSELNEQLERQRLQLVRTVKRQQAKLTRLSHERTKLLHAYTQGLFEDELLFKSEQARISREIEEANQTVALKSLEFTGIKGIIIDALELATNFRSAYRGAPDELRRKFNHTFFIRILVDQDRVVRSELTEGFAAVAAQAFASRYQRALPEPILSGVGLTKTPLVEVRGIEPLSPGDHLGLLRA